LISFGIPIIIMIDFWVKHDERYVIFW